ncbi:alkaline phosphatase synthesis transcriptional regulatory protein [Filimonas lacunae]|nr:alkaline phosphatase synthesis transcriptional regulatory protein [Filimonas lacunae]
MQHVIAMVLKREGYDVYAASNAKEAFECLDKVKCDMVLVDMMLPNTSGLEIISQIKQQWPFDTPAIIVVSALGHEKNVQDSFDLGADDFLRKPFSTSELVCRVARLLQRVAHK